MIQNLSSKSSLFYLLVINSIINADDLSGYRKKDEDWQGRWFPHSPNKQDPNPPAEIKKNLYDAKHGVAMGVEDAACDDGKTNLQVDWDFDPINYTCFNPEDYQVYKPRSNIQPIYTEEHIPKGYSALHKCMNETIEYDRVIPTFGTHRPIWPKYGEYTFLPKQRWLHNLEHGALVMLYHPCANENEVQILRNIVERCLYKHIITPYNLLSPDHPLALVTWGYSLTISKVSPELVVDFIKHHALRGAEATPKDGQYDFLLERHSRVVVDISDSVLCKPYNFI